MQKTVNIDNLIGCLQVDNFTTFDDLTPIEHTRLVVAILNQQFLKLKRSSRFAYLANQINSASQHNVEYTLSERLLDRYGQPYDIRGEFKGSIMYRGRWKTEFDNYEQLGKKASSLRAKKRKTNRSESSSDSPSTPSSTPNSWISSLLEKS